jgi:hypothetical protein
MFALAYMGRICFFSNAFAQCVQKWAFSKKVLGLRTKAFEGLRPSFSAHVRWCEHGAPVQLGYVGLVFYFFADRLYLGVLERTGNGDGIGGRTASQV